MPPVEDRLENYPDSPLKADMLKHGMSIRGLARKLAGADDLREIDKQRTNVKRWLDPENGISHASSAKLAPFFRRPASHYFRQGRKRVRQADRLEELSAQVVRQGKLLGDMAKELEQLRGELDAVRPRQRKQPRARGAQ